MSKQLQSVRKIKALAEKEQITTLGEIQAMLNSENDKLDLLMLHRESYALSFTEMRESSCETHNLMAQQSFMSNLEVAITQQKEVIRVRENELENQREMWKLAHQELKAIDNYIDRIDQENNYYAAKREQKNIDELISQRGTRSTFN